MRMLKGNSGAGSGKWRKLMGTVIPPSRIRRSRRGLITRSNASFTQQRLRSPSIIFHPNRFHLSFDWSNLPHFVSDSSSRFQWRIPAIKSGVVIPKWIQFHHSSIGRRQFEYSVRLSWIWFKWWLSPWEENGAMEKHRECCCAVCIFVSLFSSLFLSFPLLVLFADLQYLFGSVGGKRGPAQPIRIRNERLDSLEGNKTSLQLTDIGPPPERKSFRAYSFPHFKFFFFFFFSIFFIGMNWFVLLLLLLLRSFSLKSSEKIKKKKKILMAFRLDSVGEEVPCISISKLESNQLRCYRLFKC